MSTIPDVPLECLVVRAKLDYVQVHAAERSRLVPAGQKYKWNYHPGNQFWTLTVHDAVGRDVQKLIHLLSDPPLWGVEIAIDFSPKPTVPVAARPALLQTAFRALAARFRPEDELLHGGGYKAAHLSPIGQPFHRRLPALDEVLVYGHKADGHNAKLYLKTTTGAGGARAQLPSDHHSVRVETTLGRFGLSELQLCRLSSLVRGELRSRFATNFRFISHPEVRAPSTRTASKLAELQLDMQTAWSRAGVNGFDLEPLSANASRRAVSAAAYRKSHTLGLHHYRLRRDSATNAAVGNALRQLDRRLK